MKNKTIIIFLLVFVFTCFSLAPFIKAQEQAVGNCENRVNCPEETYPYCVGRVHFNDCTGQNACWEGQLVGGDLIGDCTYRYDPNPPEEPVATGASCGNRQGYCPADQYPGCSENRTEYSCRSRGCFIPYYNPVLSYSPYNSGACATPSCGGVGQSCCPYPRTPCNAGLECSNGRCYSSGTLGYSCGWALLQNPESPYHGQPAFCIGGFTEDELANPRQNYSVAFGCDRDTNPLGCGVGGSDLLEFVRSLFGRSFADEVSFASFGSLERAQSQDDGTWYTCFTGDFSSEFVGFLNNSSSWYTSVGCPFETLGAAIEAIVPTGNSLEVHLTEAALQTISSYPQCVQAFSNFTLLGEFKVDGNTLCRDEYTLPLSIVGETSFGAEYFCLDGGGIDTAIGCIPIDFISRTANFFINWAVAIGSGIVLFLLGFSGVMVVTATGKPERLQAAKELAVSAILGLLLIVFSVFLLNVVGADILQIPGFS